MKIKKINLSTAHSNLMKLLDIRDTTFSQRIIETAAEIESILSDLEKESIPERTKEITKYYEAVEKIKKKIPHNDSEEDFKKELDAAIGKISKKHTKAIEQIKIHKDDFLKTLEDYVEVKSLINHSKKPPLPSNLTAKEIIAINSYMMLLEKSNTIKLV